jgi:hypothetical protein
MAIFCRASANSNSQQTAFPIMLPEFDPYQQWLGISLDQRPADHYALLGLDRFEADPQKILHAFENRMLHLRSKQSGPRGNFAPQLLNEITQAKICLLDANSRKEYDQSLLASESIAIESAEETPVRGNDPARKKITATKMITLILMGVIVGIVVTLQFRSHDPHQQDEEFVPVATVPPNHESLSKEITPTTHGIQRDASRQYVLTGENGVLTGRLNAVDQGIAQWKTKDDVAEWELNVQYPGFYRLTVVYEAKDIAEESRFVVDVDQREMHFNLRSLPAESPAGNVFEDQTIVMFKQQGTSVVRVHLEVPSGTVIVESIKLTPRN